MNLHPKSFSSIKLEAELLQWMRACRRAQPQPYRRWERVLNWFLYVIVLRSYVIIIPLVGTVAAVYFLLTARLVEGVGAVAAIGFGVFIEVLCLLCTWLIYRVILTYPPLQPDQQKLPFRVRVGKRFMKPKQVYEDPRALFYAGLLDQVEEWNRKVKALNRLVAQREKRAMEAKELVALITAERRYRALGFRVDLAERLRGMGALGQATLDLPRNARQQLQASLQDDERGCSIF